MDASPHQLHLGACFSKHLARQIRWYFPYPNPVNAASADNALQNNRPLVKEPYYSDKLICQFGAAGGIFQHGMCPIFTQNQGLPLGNQLGEQRGITRRNHAVLFSPDNQGGCLNGRESGFKNQGVAGLRRLSKICSFIAVIGN